MNPTTIWVNGRFLSRKVTGVERVAHEILRSLSDHFLDKQGRYEKAGCALIFKLALEQGAKFDMPDFAEGWEIQCVGRADGHVWEQINLAFFRPNDWLLSLCNTGPLLRKKQAIFFHDAQVFAIPSNFDWKFRYWYRTLISIAGRMSRILFTNSAFSRNQLCLHTGLSLAKFKVNHLGCDHMNRLAPETPTELLKKLNGQPYVLAVSSSSPNKNFSGVLKALELLGATAPHCVIVGQQYSKVFKGVILKNECVTEMGYVSDEALAGLYKHAMCLVYPSFYEGFGLPPLEAMLLGCPVITSNCSSLPEVCGDAALYCDPNDPATIAAAILQLATYPDKVDVMRLKSQTHAKEFTWKKTAEKTLSTLCESIQSAH